MKLFPKLAFMVSGLLLGAVLSLSSSYYWAEQREIHQEAHMEEERVLQNLVHIAEEASLANEDHRSFRTEADRTSELESCSKERFTPRAKPGRAPGGGIRNGIRELLSGTT